MKKIGAMLLCFSLLVGMTGGCAGEKKTDTGEKTVLTLWHYWNDPIGKQTLSELVEEYNGQQDKVRVKIKYFPDEDFKKRLALSMADGDMPDLAIVDSADVKYFHAMHPLVDLSGEIPGYEECFAGVKDACCVNGRNVGLPVGIDCAVLYCNTALLKEFELEIPKTWDELYETSKILSEEGRQGRYGFAIPALQSEESVYAFLPFFWSGEGDIDKLDSEESARAFWLLRELSASEAMSTETINLTSSDLKQQFIEGNIAMMVNSSAVAQAIREENPEMEFSISLPPVYREGDEPVTTLGGEVLVALQGEHTEETLDFIRYFSQDKQLQRCAEGMGIFTPRMDFIRKQRENSELTDEIAEIASCARTREFSVEWPYISDVLTKAMEDSVIGTVSEDKILEQASEQIRKIREEKE